jgi:Ca2+-binding EF-hand superfamily protein
MLVHHTHHFRWEIENVFRQFDDDENQKISLTELLEDPKTREAMAIAEATALASRAESTMGPARDKDGKLMIDHMRQPLLKQMSQAVKKQAGAADEQEVLKALLNKYDDGLWTGNNRSLSRLEFARLVTEGLKIPVSRSEIEEVFLQFDADADRQVTIPELMAAINQYSL